MIARASPSPSNLRGYPPPQSPHRIRPGAAAVTRWTVATNRAALSAPERPREEDARAVANQQEVVRNPRLRRRGADAARPVQDRGARSDDEAEDAQDLTERQEHPVGDGPALPRLVVRPDSAPDCLWRAREVGGEGDGGSASAAGREQQRRPVRGVARGGWRFADTPAGGAGPLEQLGLVGGLLRLRHGRELYTSFASFPRWLLFSQLN